MKLPLLALLFTFQLIFCLPLLAQQEEFRCDIDRYKSNHNDNTDFNSLIDNACTEINLGNYNHALKLLADAIRVDSIASNGTTNAYIESQLRKLKRYMDDNAAAGKSPENKKSAEESSSASSQAEPVKEVEKAAEKVEPKAEAVVEMKPVSEPEKPVQEMVEPLVEDKTVKAQEPIAEAKQAPIEEPVKAAVEPAPAEVPVPEVVEKKFSPEMMEDFHNKGMQKVKQLETFVYQIGSKTTPSNIAMTSTDNALRLFDSEERTVQVSSAAAGTKNKYKVKTYLQRLRNLNYTDVKIEWADFQYASDFIKGSDGNYHGYIVFQQRFSAMLENRNTYNDITTKKIEVILKIYEKAEQGELTENWDVLLGDISVVQTEKN